MTSADEKCSQEVASVAIRYYVKESHVPFDEDATHEFKGHKNLGEEDLPPWIFIEGGGRSRRTRGPISRCMNGYLNTGKGGTVYLGILDDGKVIGLAMTQYQKDHMVVALDDLLQRYTPPVEKHRYQINFVPVVDKDMTEKEIEIAVNYDSSQKRDVERRKQAHCIRNYKFCWCDIDRIAMYHCGVLAAFCVIEIVIAPWDGDDTRNKYAVGRMRAPPVHEDEHGSVYFRRQATVAVHSMQEIIAISRQCARSYYRAEINVLREALHSLRLEVYGEDRLSAMMDDVTSQVSEK